MLENTEGAIKNGQPKETGNIAYTRHKTQDEDKQSQNTTKNVLDNTMRKQPRLFQILSDKYSGINL
jgi:hypothetical protein